MLNLLLFPLIVLAGIGLILSLAVHIASLLPTVQNPFGQMAWDLHVGSMVVAIPTILVFHWLTRDFDVMARGKV